ncbi:MAG: hypothetical protein IJS32_02620 [Kiritimatiellae bacterium]|nr:hypothetical protein [Kiritimatiellia bacterium]
MPTPCTGTVTFCNGVRDADAWILPQTPEILKTTAWGTPGAAKVRTGESRPVPLPAPGDGGFHVFRMIDADGFFYAANGIALEDGWTLAVKGGGLQPVILEISDGNGVLRQTREVFSARL